MRRTRQSSITVMMIALVTMGACGQDPPPHTVMADGWLGDEQVETCAALQRIHAEAPPVETLEAGDITVPDVEGVGPLRAVVVPADPDSPRMVTEAAEATTAPIMEPGFEHDVVVMVGSVEPGVDELADRLVASGRNVTNTGTTQVNGRTLYRTVAVKEAGEITTLDLRDCGDDGRWMATRAAIDPATTGRCAASDNVAACREVVALAEELSTAVSWASSTTVRPDVDDQGRVVVRQRFELSELSSRNLARMLHMRVTNDHWTRVDAPPCEAPVGLTDFCDTPEGNADLRDDDGLQYRRKGDHGPWTATWQLTADSSKALRLTLRQRG